MGLAMVPPFIALGVSDASAVYFICRIRVCRHSLLPTRPEKTADINLGVFAASRVGSSYERERKQATGSDTPPAARTPGAM